MEKEIVLLIGGSGYIGTHIMLALHGLPIDCGNKQLQIAIIDKNPPNKLAVDYITKYADGLPVLWRFTDLEVSHILGSSLPVFPKTPYCAIMLAALKDVSEGEKEPHRYLRTNIVACINSMLLTKELGVKRLIQASSSTVYHTHPSGEPVGTYGYTKRVTEDICRRLMTSDQQLLVLRYMNPIGSHSDIPLFPDIGVCKVLSLLKENDIFVNRGDCIRDYIHVTDLADFHQLVIEGWNEIFKSGENLLTMDVGSGKKTSVTELVRVWCEMVKSIRTVLDKRTPYEGYDTTGRSDIAEVRVPEWRDTHKRTLMSCLQDYIVTDHSDHC